jgi:hypothetical protein
MGHQECMQPGEQGAADALLSTVVRGFSAHDGPAPASRGAAGHMAAAPAFSPAPGDRLEPNAAVPAADATTSALASSAPARILLCVDQGIPGLGFGGGVFTVRENVAVDPIFGPELHPCPANMDRRFLRTLHNERTSTPGGGRAGRRPSGSMLFRQSAPRFQVRIALAPPDLSSSSPPKGRPGAKPERERDRGLSTIESAERRRRDTSAKTKMTAERLICTCPARIRSGPEERSTRQTANDDCFGPAPAPGVACPSGAGIGPPGPRGPQRLENCHRREPLA